MLIDDLIYFLPQSKFTMIDNGEATFERLISAVRFEIDNVAHYAYDSIVSVDGEGKKDMDYLRSNIPNAAPLAPSMWFEFGGLAKNAGKPATNRYGCLVSVEYDRKRHIDQLIPFYNNESGEINKEEVSEDTQWVLRCQAFANLPHGVVCMNVVPYISVAEEGSPKLWGTSWANKDIPPKTNIAVYNEIVVSLLAICFAHCKGANVEEHQPTRQVRRAAERAGKPIFAFHTIDIQPSKTVLQHEGHISENGIAKALHICRGHFAHYTVDKPLFGKYTGTFYRPMHIRGSAEKGIVAKDYRIHAEGKP